MDAIPFDSEVLGVGRGAAGWLPAGPAGPSWPPGWFASPERAWVRMRSRMNDLVGELGHQAFGSDELSRDRAGVPVLEQACGVPQQVLADLGRTAQLVAVVLGGGLDEVGVQSGQALQVLAGSGVFDASDVFAGPFVDPVGQVLGQQGCEQHRRQHRVGGDASLEGEQGCEEANDPHDGRGEPHGHRAGTGQGDAEGGAPSQPAHGQTLCPGCARG
ncbi:hypothetical protein [Streptomyces sp. NPDC047028]|uniref:hypothetical protein n=1 Tax=Streptomyces sp. NPDC047028 TaxID=3155793 RepID=UPI0033E6B6F2